MTLKDLIALIREAVAVEAQEANALQVAKEAAEAKVAELEARVSELNGLLTSSDAQVQAKAAEILEATEALKDVVEDIKEINPSVLSDTIADAVESSPEIETPEVIEEATEIFEPVPTPEQVGEAAVDAIEEALAEGEHSEAPEEVETEVEATE